MRTRRQRPLLPARRQAQAVKVVYDEEKRNSRVLGFILTFVSLHTSHPYRYRGLMAVLAVAAIAGFHYPHDLSVLGGTIAMFGAAVMVNRLIRLDIRTGIGKTRLSKEAAVITFLIVVWGVVLLLLLPTH